MRPMPFLILPIALIAGCTPQGDRPGAAAAADATRAALAKELAGLVPDAALTCLPNYNQSQLAAYGPTLIYKVSNGLKYRSDTTGGCETVARDDILVTNSPQGRVCAGDIARTVDRVSGMTTGGCALGRFVPYRTSR